MMSKIMSYILYLLLIIAFLSAIEIFNSVEIIVVATIAIGVIALIDAFDK